MNAVTIMFKVWVSIALACFALPKAIEGGVCTLKMVAVVQTC